MSKNHTAMSTLKQLCHPTQHKRKRISLHPIDKVKNLLENLIDEKQIIKCFEEYFISPVVITVKHEKIKIALDSKKLNDVIQKIKYQMQSTYHLMDTIACKMSELKQMEGTFYFSKTDLKYAYSQIPVHISTVYKTDSIMEMESPKTLKQLRSFKGSVHHLLKLSQAYPNYQFPYGHSSPEIKSKAKKLD